jgi:hypothetical protein
MHHMRACPLICTAWRGDVRMHALDRVLGPVDSFAQAGPSLSPVQARGPRPYPQDPLDLNLIIFSLALLPPLVSLLWLLLELAESWGVGPGMETGMAAGTVGS